MTTQTHRASGPAALLTVSNPSSPSSYQNQFYLNPIELDRPPLGTGSMLSRLPLLLAADEGGLVTVRRESGLDPISVVLSSSKDSGSCSSSVAVESRFSWSSTSGFGLKCLGGVLPIAFALFVLEPCGDWSVGDADR